MGSKRKRTFQVRDLAKLLDTNPRRIEGWVEQGLLKPAVQGRGPGRRREFSLDNLIQGAILLEVQWIFGEKSPVLGRVLPGAAKAVKGFSLENPRRGRIFLLVRQEDGVGKDIKIKRGGRPETFDLRPLLKPGTRSAVAIVNITDTMRKLHHRLEEYEE